MPTEKQVRDLHNRLREEFGFCLMCVLMGMTIIEYIKMLKTQLAISKAYRYT